MKAPARTDKFSDRLEHMLTAKTTPTIGVLEKVFAEQSFAIIILLLMLFPALPLPTGGLSHVFEVISMLLSLEMIAGRRSIWLPARWKNLKLGVLTKGKALHLIMKRVRWFEKHSNPRGRHIFGAALTDRLVGVALLIFCLAAFLAPPFSGLDTLPSIGAVLLCLALILEDVVWLAVGFVAGVGGIVITVGFGSAAVELIRRLFH